MYTCVVMRFRHSHIGVKLHSNIGVNLSLSLSLYIQVEFYLIQNLNHIGIKISNQCVCCYLINSIKKQNKKKIHMNRKKKEIFFFYEKKGNVDIEVDTFYLYEKEEKLFTLNSNVYYIIYNFLFLLYPTFFFLLYSKKFLNK